MEIWKEVPNTAGKYEASNHGNIRSTWLLNGKPYTKLMKTVLDERGYAKLTITLNGKKTCTRAHILVCKAFHGLPPSFKHTVNHKDGNKTNNIPENLEWMTKSEQMHHSYKVLGNIATRPRGKGVHWRAVYSDDEVRLIRKLHKEGLGYHRIRTALGNKTSWVPIQMIVTGKTYYHVND